MRIHKGAWNHGRYVHVKGLTAAAFQESPDNRDHDNRTQAAGSVVTAATASAVSSAVSVFDDNIDISVVSTHIFVAGW